MKRPQFYYVALDFGKLFKVLSDSDLKNFDTTVDAQYYSRYGILRKRHYQITFIKRGDVVSVYFIYDNLNNTDTSFFICHNFLFSDILEHFLDFKDFCVSMSDMMNGFFYQKGFFKISKFKE